MICYIEDKKYSQSGFYYLDPTYDAKYSETDDFNNLFNMFLVPIYDINYGKSTSFSDKNSYILKNDYKQYQELRFSSTAWYLNDGFKEYLNSNIKILDEINTSYAKIKQKYGNVSLSEHLQKDESLIYQAMSSNSNPIPINVLQDALYKVYKAMGLCKTKDDFGKVYHSLKQNINDASKNFDFGALNEFYCINCAQDIEF